MKRQVKEIQVNGKAVHCSHVVNTNANHQTTIHITARFKDVVINHRMTIGAVDQPLPENYDSAALQKDLAAARNKVAAMAESQHRAKLLAAAVS